MNKNGFTLLEIILFLAISSALALIAFVGLGPRLRNARFTDSVRNLQSNFESQVAGVQSGTNRRQNIGDCRYETAAGEIRITTATPSSQVTPGSAEKCTLNGVVAIFEENQVRYRNVVSLRTPLSTAACVNIGNEALTPLLFAQCFKPTIMSETEAPQLSVPTYRYVNRLTKTVPEDDIAIAYVRSPNGTETFNYLIETTGLAPDFDTALDRGYNLTYGWSRDDPKLICFGLDVRKVAFSFAAQSPVPQVQYNYEGCS